MNTTRTFSDRWKARVVGVLIAAATAQAQVDPTTPQPPQAVLNHLQNAHAEAQTRQDAAARLVSLAADEEVVNLIATVFDAARLAEDQEPVLYVLEAIRAQPTPDPRLAPILIAAAPDIPDQLEPALWSAMARFSSQGIVAALVDAAQATDSPDDQALIRDALVEITGHDDFTTIVEWVAWFESFRWVNELEWRRELTRSLADQRDRLLTAHRTAVGRLVGLSRTMYLKLEPGDQRSARLALLLGDDEPALRQLGFDLARRELLAAAGAINGEVGAAAIKLLTDQDPGVRAQAAGLIIQLTPAGAEQPIMQALAAEKSPRAAAALLAGVSRWPNGQAADPVVTWVQSTDQEVRAPAASAALALARADQFQPEQLAAVLEAIRPRPTLIAPEIRLLVTAGADQDRQRVADLLRSTVPEQRRMSAEALIDRPEAFDLVAAAAADDPALFKAAVEMAMRHHPTLGGYRIIEALEAPDERTRAESLTRLANALPPHDLFVVVGDIESAEQRIALLAPRVDDDLPDDPAPRQGLVDCLLLYAQIELSLAHPARAIIALDRIKDEPFDDPTPLKTALAMALLATGQFEAGASIETSADTWIRALEISIGAEHASTLLEQLQVRFADELTDEQQATLRTLASAIERLRAEQITDAGINDGGGDG